MKTGSEEEAEIVLFSADCRGHPYSTEDVKNSGYRALERMARHFHSINLIEARQPTWREDMTEMALHTLT